MILARRPGAITLNQEDSTMAALAPAFLSDCSRTAIVYTPHTFLDLCGIRSMPNDEGVSVQETRRCTGVQQVLAIRCVMSAKVRHVQHPDFRFDAL
jgi:hypothetical protein